MDMMRCMISLVIKFNVLSISSLNISLAVFKEKASAMARIYSRKAKVKHKIVFLRLKFTVFFFGIL